MKIYEFKDPDCARWYSGWLEERLLFYRLSIESISVWEDEKQNPHLFTVFVDLKGFLTLNENTWNGLKIAAKAFEDNFVSASGDTA